MCSFLSRFLGLAHGAWYLTNVLNAWLTCVMLQVLGLPLCLNSCCFNVVTCVSCMAGALVSIAKEVEDWACMHNNLVKPISTSLGSIEELGLDLVFDL